MSFYNQLDLKLLVIDQALVGGSGRMSSATIDDGVDAWDYRFPKGNDDSMSKPKIRISTGGEDEGVADKHQDSEVDSNKQDNDANGSEDSSTARSKRGGLTSMSSSVSTNCLQSPFLPKSSLANPLTTKEDASSIISEESKTNDSTSKLTTIQNRGLEHSIEASKSPYSPGRSSSLKNKPESSPKIISYRRSKRSTSDGSYIPDISSPKDDFDAKLYLDEFYKDTQYRYAVMKRNIDFHQLFTSIDLTDRFLDDFACALSKEILLQGRVYISEHYICFNSNLLGWVTNLIIPMNDIIKFEKKSTAGIFPNGITIETKEQTYVFASFVSRDSTFEFMTTIWQKETGKKSMDVIDTSGIDEKDETPIIESYIMSIDGDDNDNDNDNDDDDDNDNDNDNDDSFEGKKETSIKKTSEIKTKILKFKEESKYKNLGPDIHAPTSAEGHFEPDKNEIELFNETFPAPLGVVFDILFGSSNTSFHRSRIEANAGSEISEYDIFHPMEDDPTKLERVYTYRKALGYAIGPKSTKCNVSEVIEHLNFSDYIIVLSTTLTPDVPLGNSFSVKTRYVFTWGEDNQTNLKLTFFNKWTGSSWIKAVIDKQSHAGQMEFANSLLEALKQEIANSTYYIDGPTLTKETEYVVEESITSEIDTSTSKSAKAVSLPTLAVPSISFNSTTIIALLSLLVVSMCIIQIKMYNMILETNELIQKQLLLNTNLLIDKNSRQGKVELYSSDFWDIVNDKVGKNLTTTERLGYLLDQLNILYTEEK